MGNRDLFVHPSEPSKNCLRLRHYPDAGMDGESEWDQAWKPMGRATRLPTTLPGYTPHRSTLDGEPSCATIKAEIQPSTSL